MKTLKPNDILAGYDQIEPFHFPKFGMNGFQWSVQPSKSHKFFSQFPILRNVRNLGEVILALTTRWDYDPTEMAHLIGAKESQ